MSISRVVSIAILLAEPENEYDTNHEADQNQIRSKDDVQTTLVLLAYHDTPVSDSLPSPAELFFGRRINARLTPTQSVPLIDLQRAHLVAKRAAHLRHPHNVIDE